MSGWYHQSVSYLSRPTGCPFDAWDLFCATAEGHLPTIHRLLDVDPELVHHQIWYEFPIHYAVRAGHLAAVKLLLERGTNPAWSYFRYSSWQKLLPLAVERGHAEIVALLTEEMRRRFDYSPHYRDIFSAISHSDTQQASRLLRAHGELVHVGDEHGNRPLHWAILCRRPPIMEELLDAGADIQARRADLQTPLHLAALANDYWFRKGDVKEASASREAVIQLLLDRGADYEFSVAVIRGDVARIDAILQDDPDIATRLNASRRSPLGLAATYGHLDLVERFLKLGADPNLAEECCPRGAALFEACGRNDVALVTSLLAAGADPRAGSDSSGNCLSIAEHCKNENTPEVIRLLEEAGARPALWQLTTVDEFIERIQSDETLTPNDDPCDGLLRQVLDLHEPRLLQAFVARFGNEPIEAIDPGNGWNVVDSAEFLDLLIDYGLDVNRPDWLGQSYLHVLSKRSPEKDRTATAKLYLDRGIDIDAVSFECGKTAREIAQSVGNKYMLRLLKERSDS